MSRKKYSFKNVYDWFMSNKQDILYKSSFEGGSYSIADQIKDNFYGEFNANSVAFDITWDNL